MEYPAKLAWFLHWDFSILGFNFGDKDSTSLIVFAFSVFPFGTL